MEPYDLKVQQITFNEDQLQDGSLDSFSNVVHYDSALLDKSTGKKPNNQQVSNSVQFAWSSTKPVSAVRDQCFLPTPFQNTVTTDVIVTCNKEPIITTSVRKSGDFATEINQLIKDVYSEKIIPFNPLEDRKSIPDWIFLQKNFSDSSTTKQSNHFVPQPSRVKVTHIYNQTVWSEVPATAPSSCLTHPEGNPTHNTSTTTDINTLKQISSNTSAIKKCSKYKNTSSRMASNQSSHTEERKTSEPFESVAEALHLQQSVIGNKSDIKPVPPDVVAQIVAEAQRKLQTGHTPSDFTSQPTALLHGTMVSSDQSVKEVSSGQPLHLPPAPRLPDAATTRELIRIHSVDITRSTGRFVNQDQLPNYHHPGGDMSKNSNHATAVAVPINDLKATANQLQSAQTYNQGSNDSEMIPQQQVNDSLPDDDMSVASTNSELEAIGDNATESFLKSLPPFRTVNISDIMPEPKPQEMRHSPPVKETSFRPVNNLNTSNGKSAVEQVSGYPNFMPDSGMYSTPSKSGLDPLSPEIPRQTTPSFVIPKPGPLFQNTPRRNFHTKSMITPNVQSPSNENTGQIDEVLRDKAKLEGQLEMLNIEAQATLQERAELQAQVASLKLKLITQKSQKSDVEKDELRADLEGLKQLRVNLERSLTDLQRQLEERSEEGRSLQEDLNQSQDQIDRLNLKMKEIRDEVKTKDVTIQALKNKVAELYVEVQSSMQTKMEADNEARSAKSDLKSLQSTKDWYQQQLEIATKSRSELQKELTVLQAQAVSQSSIIERLKSENGKLRQQFTDIQNKALKEKELLAKHLETIECDMMDREAAFQEIQRERSFLEDTFNTKIQTAEDEKNRISLLVQMTNDLENQLDKAHGDLKKKQNQIVQLENENIELMKKLSLSQEAVIEKENVAEDLKHNIIELESKLKAFQNGMVNKDSEILTLKEDKAKTEIALAAALNEKSSVDKVLDSLKLDMGKVESSFKLMRHELSTKSEEMTLIKSGSKSAEDEIDGLKKELEVERRNCDLAKSEFENKNEQINELNGHKIKLESEVMMLQEKLSALEKSHKDAVTEKEFLDSELNATREKLDEVKEKFQEELKTEKENFVQSNVDSEEYRSIKDECVQLKEKMTEMNKDSKRDLMKQKAKAAKLSQDLNAVKTELMERQKTFDENMEVISGKLREVAADKEKLETELTMVHRKYEFSILEQKDQIGAELQNLASELQQVRLEKQALQSQYIELEHARETDLNQYQQELSALEEELRVTQEAQKESNVTMATNQELMLQLEKEKGRLAGVIQSNTNLKQHVTQLEDALASRESTLVDMQTQWTQNMKDKEFESRENIKRIQVLEENLQKEKDGQREIRKQIGQKITENKKLKRQNDGLKQDQEQLKQDVTQHQQNVSLLQSELETRKQEVVTKQSEVTSLESENKSIQRELERVQQQLYDNLAREPVIQEQIKSLEWQLELKTKELTAVHEQMKLSEERQVNEMSNIKQILQEKNMEVDRLKGDISAMKHDKQNQQAKITELRSALKSSLQYHKVLQKMSQLKQIGNSGDSVTPELPPLPFDISDMDKLLQETTVRALESKPLDNLQNCLLNLRSEISGLQAQMDVHNKTLETSSSNWSTIEEQVEELRHVVQTISNTTMATTTTASLAAAAAVDMVDKSMDIIDI
ncbi:spermatogenesis [Mactra antiquata]